MAKKEQVNMDEIVRGRRSLADTFTPDEIAKQVSSLLVQLGETKDQKKKKQIRRLLRRRGHFISRQAKA